MDDTNLNEGWFSYYIWSKINDILAIIAYITLVSGSVLTLSYLNGVSLSKRCLILYLYKDMVIHFIVQDIRDNANTFKLLVRRRNK